MKAAKSELRDALLAFQGGTGSSERGCGSKSGRADAEALLVLNRSPQRWMDQLGGLTISEVDMSDKYDEAKVSV
jgi:hypothetical protein